MRFWRGVATGFIFASILIATSGKAMSARQAILRTFGPYGKQALRVSWCESRWHTWARNGQHTGLFQLGSWERRNFARGRYRTELDQTRAAHRYFVATGSDWGAWVCKP